MRSSAVWLSPATYFWISFITYYLASCRLQVGSIVAVLGSVGAVVGLFGAVLGPFGVGLGLVSLVTWFKFAW